jgi:uncharacterized protein (TIGR04255 family)
MVVDREAMSYSLESTFPTLSRAPITEALIDFQAELPPDVDLSALRQFYTGLETRFPRIEERFALLTTLKVNESGGPPEFTGDPAKPDGFVMRSQEEAFIVQARLDGFTVNKLAPYITWKSLAKEALCLWKRYLDVARPIKVRRLAVRYTNRLELPIGTDFKESLLTVPELAPGIPQGLPEFFMRLVIPHPSGATAIVTERSEPPTSDKEIVPVIFDIDVFREVDVSPTADAIWTILDELRAYKNLIFFKTLTPSLLEKYL